MVLASGFGNMKDAPILSNQLRARPSAPQGGARSALSGMFRRLVEGDRAMVWPRGSYSGAAHET
jgi:hypothetical protein